MYDTGLLIILLIVILLVIMIGSRIKEKEIQFCLSTSKIMNKIMISNRLGIRTKTFVVFIVVTFEMFAPNRKFLSACPYCRRRTKRSVFARIIAKEREIDFLINNFSFTSHSNNKFSLVYMPRLQV